MSQALSTVFHFSPLLSYHFHVGEASKTKAAAQQPILLIPARTRSLIYGDYRFTRNSKGEEQLFNLRQDPDEMEDLKHTDSARLGVLEVLSDAMMEADDSSRGAPATESI